jgi:abelson tyrosine-protein kinase 1
MVQATNILVDFLERQTRCVVSDFGQSEMKSEVYRLSGTALPRVSIHFALCFPKLTFQPPDGTLRWQAPEILSGRNQQLTVEIDVYAFGILCSEILNKGGLPWPSLDDDAARHLILGRH